jgi:hypothetical protein
MNPSERLIAKTLAEELQRSPNTTLGPFSRTAARVGVSTQRTVTVAKQMLGETTVTDRMGHAEWELGRWLEAKVL